MIIVKGTITVLNTGTAAAPKNVNRKLIFKDSAPFTNCISEIKNTQVDDAHDIDVIMSIVYSHIRKIMTILQR